MNAYAYQPQVERLLSVIGHRIARDYIAVLQHNFDSWVRVGMEKTVADYGVPAPLAVIMRANSTAASIAEDLGRIKRTYSRMVRIQSIAKDAIKATLAGSPELSLHLTALRAFDAERRLASDRAEEAAEIRRNALLGAYLMAHGLA